jgi:hypothetical protein
MNTDRCDRGENTAVEVDDQLRLGCRRIVTTPIISPGLGDVGLNQTRVPKRSENPGNLKKKT